MPQSIEVAGVATRTATAAPVRRGMSWRDLGPTRMTNAARSEHDGAADRSSQSKTHVAARCASHPDTQPGRLQPGAAQATPAPHVESLASRPPSVSGSIGSRRPQRMVGIQAKDGWGRKRPAVDFTILIVNDAYGTQPEQAVDGTRAVMKACILLIATAAGFVWPVSAGAQEVVEPERCILDTLKSAPKDSAATIRSTCVRQYIKAVEPRAVPLPTLAFTHGTAEWFPTTSTLFGTIQERIVVRLKNDSGSKVIAADVSLIDTKTGDRQTYKAYAAFPIDPETVGTLEADVLTNSGDPIFQDTTGNAEAKRSFWKTHQWELDAVYGVSP